MNNILGIENIVLIAMMLFSTSLYLLIRLWNIKQAMKEFLNGSKPTNWLKKEI